MASHLDVIFPASMADFLTNPVDIRFGSISGDVVTPIINSTVGPAPWELIPEMAVVLALTQQVVDINLATPIPNLLEKAHPPTPCDLFTGLDHVSSMMAKTFQMCEEALDLESSVSALSRTLFGLRNLDGTYSQRMSDLFRIQFGQEFSPPQFPDCCVFQVARIVLPLNSYGKKDSGLPVLPTCETFVVSTGDPPVDGETQLAKNRCVQNNADRARCRQAEAADANKNSPQGPQGAPAAGEAPRPP
jgi:hypothetical protein